MIEGEGSDLSHLCYLCSGMHITLYISIKLILQLHHIEINFLNPSSKSRFLCKLQVAITWIIHPTKTQNDPWIFFLSRHERVWNFLVFMSLSFIMRQLAPFASLQHIYRVLKPKTHILQGGKYFTYIVQTKFPCGYGLGKLSWHISGSKNFRFKSCISIMLPDYHFLVFFFLVNILTR